MKPRIRVKAGRRETADVVALDCVTNLDIEPDRILRAAIDRGLPGGVVVLGWDADGDEYFASSLADGSDVLWLLERLKLELLSIRHEDIPRSYVQSPEGQVIPLKPKE